MKEIEATLEVNVYACKTSRSINFKVKENINNTRLVENNIVYLKIKNVLLVLMVIKTIVYKYLRINSLYNKY